MDNKGLLFIPDISGFTRFVTESEINHSRLIIQELLELLINANQIALEVSEIEGDAILFYKFGEPPQLGELYKQVEKMFCEFHKNLLSYDLRRYCQCSACASAADLSLKVITHYGEFTEYNVKNFSKLIGKDVIVAHQLLKNDIEQHEYWLVTEGLLHENLPKDFTGWMKWVKKQPDVKTIWLSSESQWNNFLVNNLKFHEESVPARVPGKVEIRVYVDENGKPTDYKIGNDIEKDMDKDAIRVAKLYDPEFVAARKNGMPVKSIYVLKVSYKLADYR